MRVLREAPFWDGVNQFRAVDGTCIFSGIDGSTQFCALHRVALEKRLPIFAVKSFDCCLEPLEIIWINEKELFLTIATEDTVDFVRWRDLLPCVASPFEDAPPIYVSMRDLLTYVFGSEFYDQLEVTLTAF